MSFKDLEMFSERSLYLAKISNVVSLLNLPNLPKQLCSVPGFMVYYHALLVVAFRKRDNKIEPLPLKYPMKNLGWLLKQSLTPSSRMGK